MTTLDTTSLTGDARPHHPETPLWRLVLNTVAQAFSRPHRAPRIEDMPEWLQRDLGHEPGGPGNTQPTVTDTAVRLLFGATR